MIERSIVEALHRAQKGSKQELQTSALKAVLDAIKADGFQDISIPAPKESAPVEVRRFSDEALFIAKSNNKTLGQQEDLIARFSWFLH